jgi:hypothetical protein
MDKKMLNMAPALSDFEVVAGLHCAREFDLEGAKRHREAAGQTQVGTTETGRTQLLDEAIRWLENVPPGVNETLKAWRSALQGGDAARAKTQYNAVETAIRAKTLDDHWIVGELSTQHRLQFPGPEANTVQGKDDAKNEAISAIVTQMRGIAKNPQEVNTFIMESGEKGNSKQATKYSPEQERANAWTVLENLNDLRYIRDTKFSKLQLRLDSAGQGDLDDASKQELYETVLEELEKICSDVPVQVFLLIHKDWAELLKRVKDDYPKEPEENKTRADKQNSEGIVGLIKSWILGKNGAVPKQTNEQGNTDGGVEKKTLFVWTEIEKLRAFGAKKEAQGKAMWNNNSSA